MRPPKHITRKDIALIIAPSITADQIRRNERKWGLDKARVRFNSRVVLYRTDRALSILVGLGFDVTGADF